MPKLLITYGIRPCRLWHKLWCICDRHVENLLWPLGTFIQNIKKQAQARALLSWNCMVMMNGLALNLRQHLSPHKNCTLIDLYIFGGTWSSSGRHWRLLKARHNNPNRGNTTFFSRLLYFGRRLLARSFDGKSYGMVRQNQCVSRRVKFHDSKGKLMQSREPLNTWHIRILERLGLMVAWFDNACFIVCNFFCEFTHRGFSCFLKHLLFV